MSKSLGNVIDPLDVVRGVSLNVMLEKLRDNANMGDAEKKRSAKDLRKEYPKGIPECGVDGLRFALCSYLEGPNMAGTINLDIQRAVSARHMCNKLWNASRFVLSHMQSLDQENIASDTVNPGDLRLLEREQLASAWILSWLDKTVKEVDRSMEAFEMASTTTALRKFLINDFCDVYLEIVKEPLMSKTTEAKAKLRLNSSRGPLDMSQRLKLLHLSPFVTEEIRESAVKGVSHLQQLHDDESLPLVHQGFPNHGVYASEDAEADFVCGAASSRAVPTLPRLRYIWEGRHAGSRVEILARRDECATLL